MNTRHDTYSLKKLLGELFEQFPGISEIHIFGSRRHRTMSTRSDLDLLVKASLDVRPEDVRDFAIEKCSVLDFFFLDRGIAISCANGSKVKAKSNRELIYRLDAVPIWHQDCGFKKADIDWEFDVIKDFNPPMTTLVSAGPLPSKMDAITTEEPSMVAAHGRSRWRDIGTHPIAIIVYALIAYSGFIFPIINNTRIVPLENHVARLERELEFCSKNNYIIPESKEGSEDLQVDTISKNKP